MTKEDYDFLKESGMFWEFHPELTGEWEKDKYELQNIEVLKDGNGNIWEAEDFPVVYGFFDPAVLNMMKEQAVESENYELAQEIQDTLKFKKIFPEVDTHELARRLSLMGHYFKYKDTKGIIGHTNGYQVKSTEDVTYLWDEIEVLDEVAPKKEWINYKPNYLV